MAFLPLIFGEILGELYHFSMADVTNNRERRGLRQHKCIIAQFCESRARHSPTGQGSRCQRALFLLEAPKESVSPRLIRFPKTACTPRLVASSSVLKTSNVRSRPPRGVTRPSFCREISSAPPYVSASAFKGPWDSAGAARSIQDNLPVSSSATQL